MGVLFGFGRGALLAAGVMLGFAILKKLIIAVGFLLAFIKFAILIVFVVLMVSIAVAIIRDWCENKNGMKDKSAI